MHTSLGCGYVDDMVGGDPGKLLSRNAAQTLAVFLIHFASDVLVRLRERTRHRSGEIKELEAFDLATIRRRTGMEALTQAVAGNGCTVMPCCTRVKGNLSRNWSMESTCM